MDVKPDNVYEAAEAMYKLGDFGLATGLHSKMSLDIEEGDNRYTLSIMNTASLHL